MDRFFRIFVAVCFAAPLADADDFSREVTPLLKKYCYSCHGPEKQKGGIEVHHLLDTDSAFRHHRFLESIAHAVEVGEMPPEDEEMQPGAAERAGMIAEIRRVLGRLETGDFARNPGRVTLRRLNRNEYNQTVRDLYGVNFRAGADFPADGAGGEGFDNVGDAMFIQPTLMEKYLAAGRRVVDAVYQDPKLRRRVISARPDEKTPPAEAARAVLFTHASLAFRRRITDEDLAPFLSAFSRTFETGGDFDEALRLPLQALLVHPAFLFRIENDQPGKSEWRIDDFELATRLSYFLWSSMPDRGLLRLADEGRLADPEILRGEVKRMLADPRAKNLARHFGGQWLGFDEIRENAQPDTGRFPTFTQSLRVAMYRESVEFVHYLIHADRPVTELIHADYTFANDELARHYGMPGVQGADLRRVALSDPNCGGIVGHASILTATSQPLRTSPVKRGKWILDTLLGTPPPPPPPDAGVLPGDDRSTEGLSMREQLAAHSTRPSCAGCHSKIDPLGFGLEHFDAIGRWRTEDINGKPLDTTATLPGDITFSTPAELKTLLLASDDLFPRNIARKMLAYALGRPLEYYDEPVISGLVTELRKGELRVQALIHAIVQSHPFQHRSAKR